VHARQGEGQEKVGKGNYQERPKKIKIGKLEPKMQTIEEPRPRIREEGNLGGPARC